MRLRTRERATVGPIADQRVEEIGDRGDPALERDLLSGEPARIPGAVPALVMSEGNRRREREQPRRRAGEDAVADLGVPLDDLPLRFGQRPGLEQDAVRDADLADVVQAAGDADQLAVLVVEAEAAREQ
jgi:hypothetical protein